MSELESDRVDRSSDASEDEGFYLTKEQRDTLLLHLIDVNVDANEEHQQKNKELIKVLLSLSEGRVKVDDPKDRSWNQPIAQDDQSNSDESNAEMNAEDNTEDNTEQNAEQNSELNADPDFEPNFDPSILSNAETSGYTSLTPSDLFGSDLSDVNGEDQLNLSAGSVESCLFIASEDEAKDSISGDSNDPIGEQPTVPAEKSDALGHLEAVLGLLEGSDSSCDSFPSKPSDQTRSPNTLVGENNNPTVSPPTITKNPAVSAPTITNNPTVSAPKTTKKRPASSFVDSSSSHISSTTVNDSTDDESTNDESSRDESNRDESTDSRQSDESESDDEPEPQKKRPKRQTGYRTRSDVLNANGHKFVETRIFHTEVLSEDRKLGRGAMETVVCISVDHLHRLRTTEEEQYSQAFYCKKLEWRLKLKSQGAYLAVFLECMDIQQSDCLSTETSVEIALENQSKDKQSSKTHSRRMDVSYNCEADVHGIGNFYKLKKLEKSKSPFVRNDRLKLRVTLKVLKQVFHL